MFPFWRRLEWWLRGRRKEDELREELEFHLAEEAEERQAAGQRADEARWAAQRELGNEARLREEARALWTYRPLDELSQDIRFAWRTLLKHRAVSVFATLSLALGIGANTAIYSFMDAILLRSLPVGDPASLVVMTWNSKPIEAGRASSTSVMDSMWGSTYRDATGGVEGRIFPFPAFDLLQQASEPVLSSIFARFPGDKVTVQAQGEAELTAAEYVTGDFFHGIELAVAAGRPLLADDDRAAAPPVAVVGNGFASRRFGAASNAVGQQVQINNVPFTIVGVTPEGFDGIDPGVITSVYLPMQSGRLFDRDANERFADPNYYWAGIMGRLRPGVTRAQAEAVLAGAFAPWVASTATAEVEKANLPVLRLDEGAGGLDTLRRKYSKPLYLLLAMVGLILAIACANTANLLLARATTRQREIAVRLSIGAGRFRLIRQLLTESLVLSTISGLLGIAIAVAGARMLSLLLANSGDGLAINAGLNWRVLAGTVALSTICGLLIGLAPAIQSTHPALVPALKETARLPRYRLRQTLVVGQLAVLMLLLIGAGLFVRTLANLQSIPVGFNSDNLLLFEINAPQAGYPEATASAFYADLRGRLMELPGIRAATLSHSSLMRAGRSHPVYVDGVMAEGTRFMQTGPGFFSTLQIPMLQGREIDERDRAGSLPVAVISAQFARTFMPNQNPIGRTLTVGGPAFARHLEVEVVGVAATTRYGPLKRANPPVIYVPVSQLPIAQVREMVYAVRTDGDPLRHLPAIRQIVQDADARIPVTRVTTQVAEIDQTINQEIVLARLGTAFALLALLIASIGLYGTMSYGVARRTKEIGIRMALGARRGGVVWMVMREVLVLTVIGLAISMPLARGTSKFVDSFLFDVKPHDPIAIGIALATLLAAALLAGYAPARRAARIDPATTLRAE